jgi:hypothetical protein
VSAPRRPLDPRPADRARRAAVITRRPPAHALFRSRPRRRSTSRRSRRA